MVNSKVVRDNSFNIATSSGMHMIYKYNVISRFRWQRVGFFREGSASLMLSSLKEDTQEYYYMSEEISYQ